MNRYHKKIHGHLAGATLIELVVSIVVISIGLVGILLVMNRNTSMSADPMIQHQAVAIAEAYLEEIMLKDFCDPDNVNPCQPLNAPGTANCIVCPAAEGSRASYDNVCDYNGPAGTGLVDNGARDQTDTAIAGLSAYTVRTNVFTNDTLGALTGANCQVLRVDVAVTGPGGTGYTLSGYRTNFQ
jgi:MSHA pilin protein MshD